MGFRFRRSVKIAPGLRLNFGKRGLSLSAGVRGSSVTFGPRGTYSNVGIPGTGLSFRERIGGGSEKRRTERTQQRLEREYQRLEKEKARLEALSKIKLSLDKETGTLQIENSLGDPLSRQDLKFVWDKEGNTILEWLERQAEEINGDVELLTAIHEDTPSTDLEPEYEIVPFDEELPDHPKRPEEVARPEAKTLSPLGFFARLFKSKRIVHEQKQQQLNNDFSEALRNWDEKKRKDIESYHAALERYADLKKDWDSRKKEHETNENSRKDEFPNLLRTD